MSVVFPSGAVASMLPGSLGSNVELVEGAVTTTNTAVTTIATYTTTVDSSGFIWAWFSGVRTNNTSERNTFEVRSTFYNAAGILNFYDATQYWSSESELYTNFYIVGLGGNDISFRVRGQTGWDINWVCTALIVETS